MTLISLGIALATATALAGLLLIAYGIYGRDAGNPKPRRRRRSWRTVMAPGRGRTAALAAVAGIVVWALSGWPVAGIVAALAVPGLPYFFTAGRDARRTIGVLQGLEEWVRRLADAMSAGTMPIQTIAVTAVHAPAAIKPAVTQLSAGLTEPRSDRRQVLARFADTIADPLGDMVVIALSIAIDSPSPKVPDMMRTLAAQLADDVAARRTIETDRAEPRSEARTIVAVQIAFVVAVAAFTSYADAYSTPLGQLVLAMLAAITVGALVMIRRLSRTPGPPRLLGHEDMSTERRQPERDGTFAVAPARAGGVSP